MTFDSLQDYLKYLSKNNDLVLINDEVDPELELTHILSEEERIGKGRD